MRKLLLAPCLTFVGLAAFAVFAGWAAFEAPRAGGEWSALRPIWAYVIGAVASVAVLAVALAWLAFWSAKQGAGDAGEDRKSP